MDKLILYSNSGKIHERISDYRIYEATENYANFISVYVFVRSEWRSI